MGMLVDVSECLCIYVWMGRRCQFKQFGQASTSSKLVKTPPPLSKRSVKLNETPLSKKVSGAMPYTSMHYKRDTRMKELGEEMKGKFAGPISPLAFLKTFLPFQKGELARMPRRQKQMFQRVANMKKESSMYKPMIGALKRYCPGFNLVDTHSHPDMSVTNEPEIKPDVSLYESGCRKDPNVVTDISLIDMIMEFKLDPKDDPFRDNGTFEHDTVQSADTRGQITTYATKQLASQFRTHAFSVVICKDMARLIYWDRSGAVVTESFSYVEQPWLANFCWRYTHSSRQVRGIDESVTMPTDVDAAQAHRARVALELDDDKPLFKFAIYCEEGGDVSYCFGSKPWFKGNGSPTGRATRVFIVYDPVLDRRVLMKDTWRVSLDGMQTEGAIYRRLHAANVSHIARFLRGGDVTSPFCRTRSHKFARQFCLKLRPHSHYRFTLDDIGRDLTSFTTTKELVETMAGAFQGA
ncbi:hypothetical protein L208DRAFT_1371169 [Tricholoma matsutake]|nr:hypothetical protein L208DRAFT_1371169 [Tricholoma matsutake 945]